MKIKWRLVGVAIMGLVVGLGMQGLKPAKAATPSEELTSSLQSYLSTLTGDYTISVRELESPQTSVAIDENRRIDPASVIKLFYAWAAYRQLDLGRITLSQKLPQGPTWGSCLRYMIEVSDNDCTVYIRQSLGNKNLNTLFAASGYANTRIVLDSYGRYKTKYTTAYDTTLLLFRLQRGTLLSAGSTNLFHALLERQAFRSRIPSGVESGVRVENKVGELLVSAGMINADAAIVFGPQSHYVISVYGRNNAKVSEISQISKIVYEALEAPIVTRAQFPKAQYLVRVDGYVHRDNRTIWYRIPQGVSVEVIYAEDQWLYVKPQGRVAGWMQLADLVLKPSYIWSR